MHTVTTDSAKICFNVCMHKKVTWVPSKKWNKNSDCFEKSLLPFPTKNTYHAFPVFGKNVYLKWKMYLLFRYTCFITCLTYYYYYDFILIIIKYYSIKCWKYLRKNFPVVYFEEKRDCSENEYPIMFVALLILLYHYYNTYISKSSELFQHSFSCYLSERYFKWHTFEFFGALFWLEMSKVLGSFS